MNRRSLLAMLGGLLAGTAAAGAAEAAPPGRPAYARLYVPMVASPVIGLRGRPGDMLEVDATAHGVPAAAKGVHVNGWVATSPPGKVWAFSEAYGQHTGLYAVREGAVSEMFVPLAGGAFCVTGSGAPWVADLRLQGYWL